MQKEFIGKCKDCVYFDPPRTCRRYPPSVPNELYYEPFSYPFVHEDMGCGEFKAKNE